MVGSLAARRKFGNTVKRLRKERNLTQEELADLAGIERSYMSAIELAKGNPSLEKIISIANALKVTIGKLFLE